MVEQQLKSRLSTVSHPNFVLNTSAIMARSLSKRSIREPFFMKPKHEKTANREESAKHESSSQSFAANKSSNRFHLTEQETSKLESLLQWQDSSAKSVIVLGKPLSF